MAGRGPAGKEDDKRARRNAKVPMTNLSPDGELRGPTLPRGGFRIMSREGDSTYEWPEATKQWWKNWRKSAQAQTFLDSDWDFMLETAILHARFWMGDVGVAAELRLRVAKYGATPEDRLRLRMNIKPADDAGDIKPETTPAAASSSSASRERYGNLRVVS